MRPSLILAILLSAACNRGEPKVDENGCWLDGEQAYLTLVETSCTTSAYCHPEYGGDTAVEGCIERGKAELSYVRENLCFNGCTMDRCLEYFAAYRADCSVGAEADVGYCWEATFHYGLTNPCGELPW